MSEQYDLFEGVKLRDAGIAQVAEHNDSWLDNCISAFQAFPLDLSFTGEDVRMHCELLKLEPRHHNAWGALINVLIKRGMMVATGEYRQMRDKRSHARMTPLYHRP